DGTDAWPARSDSLLDPMDVTTATVTAPNAYLAGNVWVATGVDVHLRTIVGGFTFDIVVHHATVSMELSADHKKATNGVISGVALTEELADEFVEVGGAFDPSFCDPQGPTIQSIVTQIHQSSDILADGTQDPTKTCDGISVGIGFDASVAQLGQVEQVTP